MLLTTAVIWFLFALIVAVAANTRGRSPIGWFLLSVVISPLIAGLLVLALPWRKSPYDDSLGKLNIEKPPPSPVLRWVYRSILAVIIVTVGWAIRGGHR